MSALVSAARFIRDPDVTYLNTAARGLVPAAARAACAEYFAVRAGTAAEPTSLDAVADDCRQALARLLGVAAPQVAFVGSTSDACSGVFALIDWRAGDNVVVVSDSLEFPSVLIPAHRLGALGVTVRVVEPDPGADLAAQLVGAVDGSTRLVFVSHVSYRTGQRIDLETLAAGVRARGPAWFAADVSQSLGVVPVPAQACDFVVSTAFKWTLGAHGVGLLYWNPARAPDPRPVLTGWHAVRDDSGPPYGLHADARRFEAGNLAYLPIFTLRTGLAVLEEVGQDRIMEHILALGERLATGLLRLGHHCLTPTAPAARAGIVSWADDDCAQTAVRLAAAGIRVTGSAGRVRASVHLYNSHSDVDRLLDALA